MKPLFNPFSQISPGIRQKVTRNSKSPQLFQEGFRMDMKKSFYDEVILFEVDDAGAAVGFETGFLDGIVERAGIAYLLKGEFGVRLVRCD